MTSKMNIRRDCSVDVIKTPFSLLDGDTMCEILVRLPVKSLLQAKRVCTHWNSIVRDPYFVDLHYIRSKACPKLLIFVSKNGRFLFSVDLFQGGILLDQMKVELPSIGGFGPVLIMNPVNGLVCFKNCTGNVLIYNPSTGDKTSWIESRVAREEKRYDKVAFYGFGFDSNTKEHKVVFLWHSNNTRYETGTSDFCEVLTVGKNTWSRIHDVPPYKEYGESVHVNGVVYWLSTYKYHYDVSSSADAKSIVAFDIGREKFRVIPIPDFIADCRRSGGRSNNCHDLLVIDGCVSLLDRRLIVDGDNKNVIKMWIFHDDHNANSFTASNWTEEKILIPLKWEKKLIRCIRDIPCSDLLFQAITGTNLIIMMPESHQQRGGVFSLYCYDRKKKTLDFVEINTISNGEGFLVNETVHGYTCGTFVESLYPVSESSRRERIEEMKKKQIASP